ncbi:hypothetical protein D3C84_1141210 [compost metagenome]
MEITGRRMTLKLHILRMMPFGLEVRVSVGYLIASLCSFMAAPTFLNRSRSPDSRFSTERSNGIILNFCGITSITA